MRGCSLHPQTMQLHLPVTLCSPLMNQFPVCAPRESPHSPFVPLHRGVERSPAGRGFLPGPPRRRNEQEGSGSGRRHSVCLFPPSRGPGHTLLPALLVSPAFQPGPARGQEAGLEMWGPSSSGVLLLGSWRALSPLPVPSQAGWRHLLASLQARPDGACWGGRHRL